MLGDSKLKVWLDLIQASSKEELIWMNGYLTGLIAQFEQQAAPPAKAVAGKVTIAYGTETGNSKKLAGDFAARAKKNGINAKVVSLDQYRMNDLSKEEYFLTVISTQGDGEPPAAAKKFYDHIHQNGFKLEKLKYSVLALGDTAYPLFCKAGEDVDSQLNKLGGNRITPLKKCDTDYADDANDWFQEVIASLSGSTPATATPMTARKHSGKKNLTGTILTNINLNDRGSNKETYHIEIAADDLDYAPGDSIGIVPENPTMIVNSILELTSTDPDRLVEHRNGPLTIENLLRKKAAIIHLPERVVKKYAAVVQQEIPDTRIDLLDLLRIYPVKDHAQWDEVLSILEPITPRLYSIASSPIAHEGEVHITVAKDTFCINEEMKNGLCSAYLSQLEEHHQLDFYIHKNFEFRLPAPDKDVIMIGPGTGIAPFRAFLSERDALGADGKNWLFFGDQHFETDFLYQTEIQNWQQTGVLNHVNVAFSRDQDQKIYVQHKMLQHGAALYEWIESGAYLYICGAKEPMSVDVENTLLQIFMLYGNKSTTAALQYLDTLKEQGRYLKDVY